MRLKKIGKKGLITLLISIATISLFSFVAYNQFRCANTNDWSEISVKKFNDAGIKVEYIQNICKKFHENNIYTSKIRLTEKENNKEIFYDLISVDYVILPRQVSINYIKDMLNSYELLEFGELKVLQHKDPLKDYNEENFYNSKANFNDFSRFIRLTSLNFKSWHMTDTNSLSCQEDKNVENLSPYCERSGETTKVNNLKPIKIENAGLINSENYSKTYYFWAEFEVENEPIKTKYYFENYIDSTQLVSPVLSNTLNYKELKELGIITN